MNSLLFMGSAPALTANATQVALSQAVAEVGGELLGKSHLPAHSPDLNPLDFMAWDSF